MSRLVAVTGATGFVGGHIARAFADAGWRVRILSRRLPLSPLLADLVPEVVHGTLEDNDALVRLVRDADAIVHAAGLVRARDAIAFYRANAHGTERMVAAAGVSAPTARFIQISSLSAREPGLSDYAGSKRAGEIEVERASEVLDWTILRPPAVYGEDDREFLPFFQMASAGWLAAPANGDARLSLIHGADLGRAVVATAHAAARHATLEVDDGKPGGYGWPDIATALGQAVGRPVRLLRLPHAPLAVVALLVEARARIGPQAPMITRGKLRELWHPDWKADRSRFDELVSLHQQVTVKEGFFSVAQAYRTAGLLPPGKM